MNYLRSLLDLNRLFSLRPAVMTDQVLLTLGIVFGLMVILGAASKIMSKKAKDILKGKGYARFYHLFLTIGILGLVYLFFAWQGVALLSARFWIVLLLGIGVIWALFIAKYLAKDVPKRRQEIEQRRKYEKYLP